MTGGFGFSRTALVAGTGFGLVALVAPFLLCRAVAAGIEPSSTDAARSIAADAVVCVEIRARPAG